MRVGIIGRGYHLVGLSVAMALVAATVTPAHAAAAPRTTLVSCDTGSCLRVTGSRADAGAPVSINGHAVAVEGSRSWRADLPVDTVREWSTPYARTITVAVGGTAAEARLPIGLLGHAEDLAVLMVRAK